MASNLSGAAFRSIRALFTAGTVGGLTDGQLLERFTEPRRRWRRAGLRQPGRAAWSDGPACVPDRAARRP